MSHSRHLTVVTTLGAALLAGACGDASPTAPPSLAWRSTSTSGGSSRTVSFTVYPGLWAAVNIGEHRIVFEPNAICDLARSSYGPAYWDEPCTVATKGVRITAKTWDDPEGRPVIDFQPALRFNPDARVTLYLRGKASDSHATIYWVSPDGTFVDEALTDPSVTTKTGPNGFKYRRIKHFSGYLLSTGRLEWDGGEFLRNAIQPMDLGLPQLNSGHVVATGALDGSTR